MKKHGKRQGQKTDVGFRLSGMLMHATMKELINLVKTQCHIPERDKELIMGQNAKRLFFGGK